MKLSDKILEDYDRVVARYIDKDIVYKDVYESSIISVRVRLIIKVELLS